MLTRAVLPVWHCGPSETAEACTACSTASASAKCGSGFDALVLLPLIAVAGLFLLPPPGLPTLTVDEGGKIRTRSRNVKSQRTTRTRITRSRSETTSFTVPSCPLPTLHARDFATPALTTHALGSLSGYTGPTHAPSISINTDLLPVLLESPQEIGFCGSGGRFSIVEHGMSSLIILGGQDGYFSTGFYQGDDTFARADGLSAIRQFCGALNSNQSLIGPDGWNLDNKMNKNPAYVCLFQLFMRHASLIYHLTAHISRGLQLRQRLPDHSKSCLRHRKQSEPV